MNTDASSRISDYRGATPHDAAPQGATPQGAAPQSAVSGVPSTRARSFGSRWIYSLTGICFLCGGLLAMQVRAIQNVRQTRQDNVQAAVLMRQQAEQNQRLAAKAQRETELAKKQLKTLQGQLASSGNISRKQLGVLNSQIKQLQMTAGLTPVIGPGIRLIMTDNPSASTQSGGPFVPGMVHDFDLLQVVNDLRAAGAEAIAVNGRRITGYSPIRCVGPVIHINWEPAAPPFRIEATGDPDTLYAALNMPQGILDNLRNPSMGPALGIKMTKVSELSLPQAAGAGPQFKMSKVG
ncbi:MAG TPA: DUF881 domain-containing protein [Abditibacteriaceae bacterium]|jgi:uncharacterized protein YlxW (UPF0749 family)